MTREERQQMKIAKESKALLQNAKHWKEWLEKEPQTEETKGQLDVLHWLIGNMPETEKASN